MCEIVIFKFELIMCQKLFLLIEFRFIIDAGDAINKFKKSAIFFSFLFSSITYLKP